MKKRSLFTLLMALLCLVCVLTLAACDEEPELPGGDPNVGQAPGDETPHTHVYGDWTVTTAATCTAAGVQTRTCNCGASETQPIAAIGDHHYNTSNVCIKCNYALQYTNSLVYELNQNGTAYAIVDTLDENVTSIVIPNYYNELPVISIETDAFGGLSGVTDLQISATISNIGEAPFGEVNNLLLSIRVEKGNPVYHSADNCLIETASKTLIMGCKNSIIPTDGSVTAIGECAFYGCLGLTNVTVPAEIVDFSSGIFDRCPDLQEVIFEQGCGLTKIEDRMFRDCHSLTSIVIPEGVTSIGFLSFSGCGLTSITIPPSVTSIGDLAFSDCDSLTMITIPESVTSIGRSAFSSCDSLTTVYYGGSADTWNDINILEWDNDNLNFATRYYYSATQPTAVGNWWYYGNDGKPAVWSAVEE